MQELADQLLALATRPMRFETDPELLRPVDIPVLRGDHARLTKATGWEPEIPIDQTLDRPARGLAPATEALTF